MNDRDLDATPCDQPSDDEPHRDPFNEENFRKKLKILKKRKTNEHTNPSRQFYTPMKTALNTKNDGSIHQALDN
jgi:hypothetical protein